MSPIRPIAATLLLAASKWLGRLAPVRGGSVSLPALLLLAATGTLRAEEVVTETAPVTPSGEAALSETPDPVIDTPPAGDLPAPAQTAAPSPNVTVNLINRLVEKKILTREEANVMIQQAQADAAAAQQQQQAQADIAALPPAPGPDDMRVTYIPEVVKNNMRDEIKQELMAQAREEKWSEKHYPEWTDRFRPFGDIRGRYDGTFFPAGNDASGAFPNFNAINTGQPFDTSGTQFSPQYNVDQDRQRTRLRARFGTDILLGDGFNAGLRLGTGESNSPTSPNQTLGASGGNFSKYAIWLDRAFLSYDAGPGDGQELTFMMGRFDNPFFSTDVQWDDDLGFDGLAVRGKVNLTDKASTFFTAGYFPVYNTDFNFASNQPSKFESTDKWLTGLQAGIDWKITSDLKAKFSIAYYDFNDISGKLSDPFIPLSASDAGSTDTTRPGFAQRGNTYMALRDIDNSTAANDFGNKYQYQYYGLASEFRNLTITGKLDYDHYDPVRLSLLGEVTKNIAFDASAINAKAVNNRAAGNSGSVGAFDGGDTAWNLAFQVGKPSMEHFGDWQAGFGYRYVESDAVVDGFTDSDFGGGGTNVQGFTLGGSMALSPAVRAGLRWMSSDEITGPPLSTDILQFDINAKF
ncbi:MAG: putative porin [Luteolibacter sp.]|uniref:putative porin n=1 Tax=Luteolibacter sp. TaxID=1962973 RepID=UPI00326687E9